jgi:hypothetical protein
MPERASVVVASRATEPRSRIDTGTSKGIPTPTYRSGLVFPEIQDHTEESHVVAAPVPSTPDASPTGGLAVLGDRVLDVDGEPGGVGGSHVSHGSVVNPHLHSLESGMERSHRFHVHPAVSATATGQLEDLVLMV